MTHTLTIPQKAKAYIALTKFRLAMFVSFSASFGYAMAAKETFSLWHLFIITLGGYLITSGANALNQIFEKEYDALMKRTANRPLPTSQLNVKESAIFAVTMGILGVGIIGYVFNLPAALLGIIGLLSYAFVYTPFKRISPFSVFIGAIPGALPPLIGYTAVTGSIDSEGLILFAFQFFWQFPHFWAIAWLANEDYTKAGFKMLPSAAGKTQFSALMILLYALCHIPLGFLPYVSGMISLIPAVILSLIGVYFSINAVKLFRSMEDVHARKLMFASFFYLPLIQLTFLLAEWL